jgi:N-acetylglucosamine-6-sulfatase
MGNAHIPSFVDGRSLLPLANGNISAWPRTAILSEKEVNLDLPPLWMALRMQGQKYIRFRNGEEEYYDLGKDPDEVHSNPDSLDTTTRSYWEQRLDDLQHCEGDSCRTAENVPMLSGQISTP